MNQNKKTKRNFEKRKRWQHDWRVKLLKIGAWRGPDLKLQCLSEASVRATASTWRKMELQKKRRKTDGEEARLKRRAISSLLKGAQKQCHHSFLEFFNNWLSEFHVSGYVCLNSSISPKWTKNTNETWLGWCLIWFLPWTKVFGLHQMNRTKYDYHTTHSPSSQSTHPSHIVLDPVSWSYILELEP